MSHILKEDQHGYIKLNCYSKNDEGIERGLLPIGNFKECIKKVIIPKGSYMIKQNSKFNLYRTNFCNVENIETNVSCRSILNPYLEVKDNYHEKSFNPNHDYLFGGGITFFKYLKDAEKFT
jgi:hypothetical protein